MLHWNQVWKNPACDPRRADPAGSPGCVIQEVQARDDDSTYSFSLREDNAVVEMMQLNLTPGKRISFLRMASILHDHKETAQIRQNWRLHHPKPEEMCHPLVYALCLTGK